ncbi:MAG TPA: hypothetical protein VFI33_12080, partial [Puia sp.]|nr:hypothetical protein [Puia sp.]
KVNGTTIRIKKNKNNSIGGFWNPIGRFHNSTLVKKDGKWYHCSIDFFEKGGQRYLCIRDLIMHQDDSNIVKEHIKGTYKELPISKFKMNLLKLLKNAHVWNGQWFNLRRLIFKSRLRTFLFLTTIALAVSFYFGNQYNSAIGDFFIKNPWVQILSIILNIISFGSLFLPFTFRKELSEEDIKKLFLEQMKKYEKDKDNNERSRKQATIG